MPLQEGQGLKDVLSTNFVRNSNCPTNCPAMSPVSFNFKPLCKEDLGGHLWLTKQNLGKDVPKRMHNIFKRSLEHIYIYNVE